MFLSLPPSPFHSSLSGRLPNAFLLPLFCSLINPPHKDTSLISQAAFMFDPSSVALSAPLSSSLHVYLYFWWPFTSFFCGFRNPNKPLLLIFFTTSTFFSSFPRFRDLLCILLCSHRGRGGKCLKGQWGKLQPRWQRGSVPALNWKEYFESL